MSRADQRLAAGRLAAPDVRALADALVARHARMQRTPDAAPDAAALAAELEGWAAALDGRVPDAALGGVADAARGFLAEQSDRLLARAGDGRILGAARSLVLAELVVDAGGARVEEPEADAAVGPGDTCVEVAGLHVDLVARGRADLGERLLSHYAGEAEDFDLYGVIGFYERRCALERATALAADGDGAAAERLLAALDAAEGRRLPRLVVAVSGPVASGKSSLARALADDLGAPRAEADRIRDHLVHGAPARPLHEAGWAEGFEPGFGPRVYAELLRRGESVLASGRGVILDACFPSPRERAAARSLALRHRVPFCLVECRVDRATQRERLDRRDAESGTEGWQALADAFAARCVAADELPAAERLGVDTAGPLEVALARLREALAASGLPGLA